ncbi:hypothetical protein EK21DRAFT_42898, partial [Setomelanomma holmii]
MSPFLSTLLFAGAATAQITTSFLWLKAIYGTDKLGFYGSVVSASNGHTTLALTYDNGTDVEALNLGNNEKTVTVGPTMVEAVSTGRAVANFTNAEDYTLLCEYATPPPAGVVTCTASYGPALARAIKCPRTARTTGTRLSTDIFTYSGRGSYSAGVETIVRTVIYGPYTRSRPDWCDQSSFLPASGYSNTDTVKKEDIGTYQVVITAGQEKLSATQSAAAS